ncbi:MAG: hypothetical protein WEB30_04215 [Cyclobacteriaceae bacterium]
MPNRILAVVLMCVYMTGCGQTDKMFKAVFKKETHEQKWAIKSLNPQIATDWTSFEYLTFDMKSSTAQRLK